jgi:hypothetical protein
MRQQFACILSLCLIAFIIFDVCQIPSASARDPQTRNWVDVDVSYLSSDGIVLKIIFETTGDYLNQDVVIRRVLYGDMVTVTIDRAVMPAYYSVDTNMTVFQYTLPDGSYTLSPRGSFPSDSWSVTMTFITDFHAPFDSHPRFSSTPSPNYFCEYSTTHSEGNTYNLIIDVKHPSSFTWFVYITYISPIVILLIIFSFLTIILARHWQKIEEVRNDLLLVSLAAIVFIPIYQLPLSSLKMPFLVTLYDSAFLFLFVLFLAFVIVVIWRRDST